VRKEQISEKFYEGLRKKSVDLTTKGIKGARVKLLYFNLHREQKYLTIEVSDVADFIYKEMLYQLHIPKNETTRKETKGK